MARVKHDMVRQLEQPPQARMQQPRLPARIPGDVEVGTADVADQQRIAAENEPRLLIPAPPVGDDVGVVSRRVARRRDRSHDRIAELDPFTVA